MKNIEKLAKIAINKSLLKEYSNSSNERIVYMNDGTEFQIQIFNPYDYTIAVSFDFNNQSAGSQMLVLKPGERVWLDRFLNNESKLLFSTYKVGASKEVEKAIKSNGNLCIRFYKEKLYNNTTIWVSNPVYTYEPYNYKLNEPYSTCELSYSLNSDATSVMNFCDASVNTIEGAITTASAATSASTSISYSNDELQANAKSARSFSRSLPKSIETGRIEKGSHSDQKFEYVNKDFESWPFKTETIKILPLSQKPVRSTDLTKRYCYNCGRKLNQKYTYCPFCGTKQE